MNSEDTFKKLELLQQYSNPTIVRRKLRRLYGKDHELYLSTRKDKKYMIYHPETNKKSISDFLTHRWKIIQSIKTKTKGSVLKTER
jgi:hypothetical protein